MKLNEVMKQFHISYLQFKRMYLGVYSNTTLKHVYEIYHCEISNLPIFVLDNIYAVFNIYYDVKTKEFRLDNDSVEFNVKV